MPLSPELTEFTTGGAALINVDFKDFATGTGFVTFYGTDSNTSVAYTSANHALTTTISYANLGFSIVNLGTALDIDFDVQFNRPISIKGEVIVNVPYLLSNSGAPAVKDENIIATLRHWDGTTETDLGTATSRQVTATVPTNDSAYGMATSKFTISKKHFAVGDTLRLTITSSTISANGSLTIGHDPKGRLTVNNGNFLFPATAFGSWEETTALTVQIPVETEQ